MLFEGQYPQCACSCVDLLPGVPSSLLQKMLLKGPVGGFGGVLLWHRNRMESSFPRFSAAQRKRLEIAGGSEAAGESAPQSGAWRQSQRRPEREGIFSQQGPELAKGVWMEGRWLFHKGTKPSEGKEKPSWLSGRLRCYPTLWKYTGVSLGKLRGMLLLHTWITPTVENLYHVCHLPWWFGKKVSAPRIDHVSTDIAEGSKFFLDGLLKGLSLQQTHVGTIYRGTFCSSLPPLSPLLVIQTKKQDPEGKDATGSLYGGRKVTGK